MLIKNLFFNIYPSSFSKTLYDQCVVSGGNFLSSLILIKFLGIEDFGIFSKIWIIIISVNIIQQAILLNPLLSISSKLSALEKIEYIRNSHFLQIIFSIITSLFLFFLIRISDNSFIFYQTSNLSLFYILFSMSIIQLNEFYRKSIYTSKKIENLLKLDLTRYISQILILLFALIRGFKAPENILIVYSFSCSLSFLMNLNLIPKIRIDFSSAFKTIKKNWLISRWLLSQSLISWFQSNYLLFLTSYNLGTIILGIIRTFQSILGIFHIFLHSIDNWLPVQSGKLLKNKPPYLFKKNILKIISKFSIFFIGIFLILISFSKFILFPFDKSLLDYIYEFRVFCIVYLIMSINYLIKNVLLGIEKTISNFYGSIISVLIIIIFGNFFLNNFGLIGIIILYILSNFIILISNIFYLKIKLKYLEKI